MIDTPGMAWFPSSPEQATPAWLTTALAGAGDAWTGRVVSAEHEPIGAGKLGLSTRFRLTWSPEPTGGPRSVVGKFPSANPRSRRTGVGSGAYFREVAFYQQLAPLVTLPVPRCYWSAIDGARGDFAILLSDVSPARSVDQVTGASADEIACALQAIGGLHARFLGAGDLARHDWLPVRAAAGGRRMAAAYRLVLRGFLERFGSDLSGATAAVFERLDSRVRAWLGAEGPPFTLLHGDYRVDNLLFGSAGMPAVTVVDWQTVAVGPAACDAAYLVGGSLPVEARRGSEDALFETYWDALRVAGAAPGREDCWRSYRLNALSGVHMTAVGAMLVEPDERNTAMFATMAERHAAHVADLESFALLDGGR